MLDASTAVTGINFLLVFAEGLLSFFSPCVLPLLPVYISYLAGNAKIEAPDGTVTYKRGKVFLQTVTFVLGISFAFFILGMSFSALGTFLNTHKLLITRIGGVLITFLGLVQLGVFNFKFMQREKRLHFKWDIRKMNPLIAFVMGFTFSFAWTPCVGPALSSVLILAAGAKSALIGNLLVFVYALGFVIPFLLLGLFTTGVLNFLNKRRNFMKYTVKIGGAVLVVIGIMTFTGWLNTISGYLNSFTVQNQQTQQGAGSPSAAPGSEEPASTPEATVAPSASAKPTATPKLTPAIDFTLTDQYGNTHRLSDYKGKTVFLNFWATWCPPCRQEMPHIEELYNEYGKNSGDVVILGVAGPGLGQETNEAGIKDFLIENGYTFPVVMDTSGELFNQYYISAFPTTFMINSDGYVYGYVPGAMNKSTMQSIISQTLQAGQ